MSPYWFITRSNSRKKVEKVKDSKKTTWNLPQLDRFQGEQSTQDLDSAPRTAMKTITAKAQIASATFLTAGTI